jgi:hypothetical protein
VRTYLVRLEELIADGRRLRDRIVIEAAGPQRTRAWQERCAEIVNELSGGSKAHWLARAFSDAFLVRSPNGGAAQDAPLASIVDRLLDVLARARLSLTSIGNDDTADAPVQPHRFDFVHRAELRPILEQAYANGRAALERGQFEASLMTTCSVLEAVLADALEHAGRNSHELSFEARIAAAEEAGLIRGGCARLPPVARRYRELADENGSLPAHETITARDARTASQVLQVVMRDLDPGR